MDGQSNLPPLRSERRKKIVELRNKGLSARQIAAELQIDYNVLSATLADMRKKGYVPYVEKNEAVKRQKASRNIGHIDPDVIIKLKDDGWTQEQIAEKTKEPFNFVANILKGRRSQKTEEFRLKVIELYKLNFTYEEMAKELNSSVGHLGITVRRLVQKGRLKYRSKHAPT